jgi:hypothetical protein|tara:strand:- start:2889 stop:3596 length:708 start_codon:yes stop_codon:yes gene_type:complete
MALPKLNDTPSYTVTVPSTGQQTTFRPFLVKEQKALMIAYETQDRKDMLRSVVNTIEACIEEPIKGTLATFDVDYLFTKIRAKSVGESADINAKCSECETENEVKVDIDKVEVVGEVVDSVIALNDKISIKMKYPSYEDFLSNDTLLDSKSEMESMLQLSIACIDSVLTEDERISMKDESKEEVMGFIDSMSSEQFEKITNFISSVPSVTQTIEFECTSCSHKNERTLKGMDDFF